MAKFDTTVKLIGENGNAFSILARVDRALREAGATPEERNEYMDEAMSGSFEELLRVTMQWVSVE